jgi:hypothetical protein
MGWVSAGGRCADQLWRDANLFGQTVSPDDAYSALKGLPGNVLGEGDIEIGPELERRAAGRRPARSDRQGAPMPHLAVARQRRPGPPTTAGAPPLGSDARGSWEPAYCRRALRDPRSGRATFLNDRAADRCRRPTLWAEADVTRRLQRREDRREVVGDAPRRAHGQRSQQRQMVLWHEAPPVLGARGFRPAAGKRPVTMCDRILRQLIGVSAAPPPRGTCLIPLSAAIVPCIMRARAPVYRCRCCDLGARMNAAAWPRPPAGPAARSQHLSRLGERSGPHGTEVNGGAISSSDLRSAATPQRAATIAAAIIKQAPNK